MLRSMLFLGAVALLVMPACVSETTRSDGQPFVDHNRNSAPGSSPVEVAQNEVRTLLGQMRITEGRDLVGTIERLVRYGTLAVVPIRESLVDADVHTRANLVYVLGMIGGPEAHRLIADQVSSTDVVVRYEAAAALAQTGDWTGVPILIDLLRDDDRRLRYKAFQSLKTVTHQDFGYEFGAAAVQRDAAAARWSNWWQTRRAEMIHGN